jgi:putative ABC transport system permease protein
MNSLTLGLKSFKHRPLNALLSILLMAFGLGLILVLLASQKQFEGAFTKNIKGIDMVVGAKGSPLQLILSSVYHVDAPTGNILLSEFQKLAKNPLVKKAIPLSYGDNFQGFRIVGTQPSYPQHYQAQLARGVEFSSAYDVTLGATVAKNSGLKVGDHFHSNHGFEAAGEAHNHEHFVIRGIYENTGTVLDQLILTPLESIWQVHDHGEQATEKPKEITAGLISFKSPMATLMLPRQVNMNTSMQAALPAIEVNRLFTLAKSASQLISALGVLLMFIAAISVFTAIVQSLREEEPHLAYLRAIGASRTTIFGLIISKGILLSLLGFIVAVVVSQIALLFMANFLENTYHYTFTTAFFNYNTLLLGAGSLALGFLASLGPAWRAYRLNISKTLAHA